MKISKNVQKVAAQLFSNVEEESRFLETLEKGGQGIPAIIWTKDRPAQHPFEVAQAPVWLPRTVDVVTASSRPGRSENHASGEIYCLDLSSVFACAPLSEIRIVSPTVIDICAAPGGKGILAWSLLAPRLTVANEVIGKRTAQLISNYKRCGIAPAAIVSMDPERLGESFPGKGEVVIVDAPCSGQSLSMKEDAAPGAFHPATISMNARRQRRILAHASRCVAPGGVLLYATCTFSREENEGNIEWFANNFPEFIPQEVQCLQEHRSRLSPLPTYRLWPYQGLGAGSFCALLRRTGELPNATPVSPELLGDIYTFWRSEDLRAIDGALPAGRAKSDRLRRPERRKGKGRQEGRNRRSYFGSGEYEE